MEFAKIEQFTNKRPNYFGGQYLLEDDFQLEQQYHIDRQRWHHHLLHVSGIAEGLKVTKGEGDLVVTISEGSAIDPQGRQITLLAPQKVDLTKAIDSSNAAKLDGSYTLYIGYSEQKTDQQTAGIEITSRRWQEVPKFQLSSSELKDFIPLAKLTISSNAIQGDIDNSIGVYSGLRLPSPDGEITLRSQSDGSKSVAELRGSLSIVGTATISDGTSVVTKSGFMESGSLTIGSITKNYGGETKPWQENKEYNAAGLLLETAEKTEIAVHDSNTRLASLMYYEGDATNRITIGRDMGWGAINTVSINGNVGIGTTDPTENPTEKLEVTGNIKATGTLYASGNPLAYENYEIYVRGAGLESHDEDGRIITHLKIANVHIPMESRRGLNTTILRQNGTYKNKKENHDVWQSAQLWDTWADWIENNATDGDVVAVASLDAISHVPKGGKAEILLKSIGAWKALDPNCYYRVSYALLFIKGRSGAMEVLQPTAGANAHLKTTYYHLLNNEGAVVRGMIMMWSGEATVIPGGWALCDGQNGTPDLRDKFLVGAGQKYKENEKGEGDNHRHSLSGIVINNNTQNAGQHTHGISRQKSEVARKKDLVIATKDVYEVTSDISGESGNHNHSFSIDLQNQETVEVKAIRPPWYALCFIMKL